MYSGMAKGTSRAEVMLNSEKIKPVTLDLPRPSFVSHSSLFTTKSVNGFHLIWKSSVVATLITKVHFEQLLIRTAE